MKYLLIIFILLNVTLNANPWGKDADLDFHDRAIDQPRTSPLNIVAQALIRFHQEILSPAEGPHSHYHPSSSQYTLEAIKKYGFLKGYLMGCDRLMRENSDPWVYSTCRLKDGTVLKKDPVP